MIKFRRFAISPAMALAISFVMTAVSFLSLVTVSNIKVQAATNYYVSTSGNDSNDGLTTNTPFKTLTKVNSLNLGAGDQVLFKCGDVWQGESLTAKNSGTSGSPIVFGSYPTNNCSNKPSFSGSLPISGWTSAGGSVYYADLSAGGNAGKFTNGVNQLFKNDVRYQLARWPNINAASSGYTKITAQNGNQITVSGLPAGNWVGASAHIRGMTWYIQNFKVTAVSGSTLTLSGTPSCYDGGCAAAGGWGMWLDNVTNAIDQDGEWSYDSATNRVYLQSSSGTPTGVEGSVVQRTDTREFGGINLGTDLSNPISYVTVNNLEAKNWYRHGISAPTNFSGTENKNLIIQNNSVKNPAARGVSLFTWTFSSTDGLGDGWRGGTNLTFSGNTIDGANTAGFLIGSRSSTFSDNTVTNQALYSNFSSFGMGCGDTAQGFLGTDCTEDGVAFMINRQGSNTASNNTFLRNNLTNLGYSGFLDYGPSNAYTNNYIYNFGLTKAEAVGIRLSGSSATGSTADGNVIVQGIGNLDGTDSNWDSFRTNRGGWSWGIHADLSSNFTSVTNNTVANTTATGLNFDTTSGSVTATGNVLFNNKRAGLTAGGSVNVTFQNNVNVQEKTDAQTYELDAASNLNSATNNNYLFNPFNANHADGMTFANWKSSTGRDAASKTNWYTQAGGESPKAQIFYNPTNTATNVTLNGSYVDLDNVAVTSPITLQPYRSRVLVASAATNQNPTVSLTAPTNNQTYTAPATVTMTATASDPDGTISKVEFYQGTTLLNTDTTAPYTFDWTSVPAGTYSITAKAYDNLNAVTTSSAVSITVNAPANQNPTVSLTSPTNNQTFTAPASVTLSATASDPDGTISKVEFYQGTTLLNTDTASPYTFNWTNVAAGTYSITAKAYDNLNAVTTSSAVSITVNPAGNQSPTISLTAPTNNQTYTAPATVTMTANAADSDGTISKVEFYQGTTLLNTDTTAPYTFDWTNVPAGTYSITAKATDNSNAVTTSSAVSITVNAPANQNPTVSITSPTNNQTFTSPATYTFSANASDPDGTISKVEFYSGPTLLATDTGAPYTVNIANIGPGTYTLTAKAYDNLNAVTTSSPITIVVNPAPNQNPTVSLTSPTNNQTFTAPASVTLSANASDPDGTISKVEFYQGTTLLNTDTTAPYTFNWTNVPAGTYTITAKAYDNSNASVTSSAASITVSNPSAPVITIASNPANTVDAYTPFTLTATVSSPATITKVEFFRDYELIGTVTSAPYTFTISMPQGDYNYMAKAYDNAGQSTMSGSIPMAVRIPFTACTVHGQGQTNLSPTIGNLNGRLFLAHVGLDSRIYIRSSNDGASTWSNWSSLPGLTQLPVTMATVNGRLFITHRGNDSKIYTASTADGVNWTGWGEAGGLTDKQLSLAGFNGRLYQSHIGQDSRIYTRSSTDGVNWTAWQSSPGTSAQPLAMTAHNGRLYQSHRGDDRNIYTRSSSDGNNWTGWQQSFGQTDLAPSLMSAGGVLYQTVIGFDSFIYTRSNLGGDNAWTIFAKNNCFTTVPISQAERFGSLFQVFRGSDQQIYIRRKP